MWNKSSTPVALLVSLALCAFPIAAGAQESGISTREDLATVLALKGKPCGEIVDLRRQGENDYLVTCRDGHRYRVFIDTRDRVVVEERD